MDLYMFNQLSCTSQMKLVLDYGELLAARTVNNSTVCLYDMNNFFTEIWYEPRQSHIALKHKMLINPRFSAIYNFENEQCFEPYLMHIDISKLLVD